MVKRASLSNLSERLNKKQLAPDPASAPEGEGDERQESPGRRKTQPDGRKGILVRARPEAWKALKLVALDRDMTLQDVMTEAINDVLQKNGKPPIA